MVKGMAARFNQVVSLPDEPENDAVVDFYIRCFFELDTERHHGNGWMMIPWSRIQNYGREIGMDEEQLDTLHIVVSKADAAWIKALDDKQGTKK